jgi:ferric-dicitrate binding protein FerR (iron transport regulator)
MKNDDSNKYEIIASKLHDEEADLPNAAPELLEEDQDFKATRRIYEVKEMVTQLGKLKSTDEAWMNVKPRLVTKRAINWQRWFSYAAVFAGAVILNTIFMYSYLSKDSDKAEVFATITSPRGQITSMTLFDGTTVWLNSGSSLKYSNQFGEKQREVTLDGEALFEVKKDTRKSFVVNMDGSTIEVHGTVFNAKNYHTEKEVVLLEGKIEFRNHGKAVDMSPNDRVVVNKNTEEVKVDQVNGTDYKSWIGGKINFDNETLENLALRLERWYDIEFEFEKSNIKAYKFSGVINKDKSLDYTLRIIQLTNKVKFRKEADKIFITE